MKRTLLSISVALMLMAQGCYNDNEEELYEFEDALADANCDVVSVSFSDDIFPIIQGNCAISGCHVSGGSGNGIFENYGSVMEKVDNGSLRERVIDLQSMPPSTPITGCQMSQMEAWLNDGAPNN